MKLNRRDWVQLSAYLDGEIEPRELDQLRARLAADPTLQAALEELRRTKQVLKHTPRLRVPRNFTLSPAQLGLKSRVPVSGIYRLATATMSFLLIGALFLDFGIPLMRGASAPAVMLTAEEAVLEKAVEEPPAAAAEEPPLLAAEAEGESDRIAADQETQPPEAAEALPVEEAPLALSAESEGDLTASEPAEISGEEASAAQENALDQAFPATPSPSGTWLPPATPSLPAGEEIPLRGELSRRLPVLRILEILFGAGVIGFGAAAWTLRRKGA